MEHPKFNENRDFKRVVSGLSVSLTDALKTGIVKDGTSTLDYNAIDNPEAVIGRVESIFDAIEASRAIKKYGKKSDKVVAAVEKEVTPSPSAE